MDYSRGYTSSFYATTVNPMTWGDTGRIEIVSGSINRINSELRQSASLSLTNYDNTIDRLIRVYMVATQGSNSERIPIFTGHATSPGYSYNLGVLNVDLQCYSVLKPAEDIILKHGWYIKEGNNCLEELKELLEVTGAPLNFVEHEENQIKALKDDIVAEDNETNLSMVQKLLTAIDWVMWIDGDGTIELGPNPANVSYNVGYTAIFSPRYPVVETVFNVDHDVFECPNCLRVSYGDYYATAKDENEDSPLSIQNRGREIWAVEDNVDLLKDKTIGEYAEERLKELQMVSEVVSYDRCYVPEVNVDSKIGLAYPEITGTFIVESQNITLGHAAVVSEQIKRSA